MSDFKKIVGASQTWGNQEIDRYYGRQETNDHLVSLGLPALQAGELACHYAARIRTEQEAAEQEAEINTGDSQDGTE